MKSLLLNIFILFIIGCSQPGNDKDVYSIVANNQLHFDTISTIKLFTLKLKDNQIPDSIFKMPNLKEISIWGMPDSIKIENDKECWQINDLPAKIKTLKKLEKLEIRYNQIQNIPIELAELKYLTQLDLEGSSSLSNIENITMLNNLEVLGLNFCNITKLPDNIYLLKKLEILGLVGNNINQKERERIVKALPGCQVFF